MMEEINIFVYAGIWIGAIVFTLFCGWLSDFIFRDGDE